MAEREGIVTDGQDGDTLTLANWQYTYKIRLVDIDAPEMNQPRGEDRFGRTLAAVTCAGVNANAEQVRQGWA